MARKSTGSIVVKMTRRGLSYGIRFQALGARRYVHVGYASDGVTRTDAERELAYVLEQVRRGEWRASSALSTAQAREMPTFHEWASEWFEGKRVEGGHRGAGLSASSEANLHWQLSVHLLPSFASRRLDEITIEDVDNWRRAKVREKRLAAGSINRCISTLAAILDMAVEYEYIERNPAAGRRRKLSVQQRRGTYIDRASHIEALLDAATELDQMGRSTPYRRALIATLIFAGPRIDEALSIRWRDLDLGGSTLHIHGTKTNSANRVVRLVPILRDELAAFAAGRGGRGAPGDLIFGTPSGRKHSPSNVRTRVLRQAVEVANEKLASAGEMQTLDVALTPQSLRRTFASILYALGEAPPYVMAQMGHRTADLALRVYAQEMERRDGEQERLKTLVQGRIWAPTGTSDESSDFGATDDLAA